MWESRVDRGDYCRQIEAYLCQKNGGHLIRLVGPAFETVCGWADRGVPLTIACQGIDRFCERQAAKGGRRRPVHIQFCDADVMDVFDDWRRTVGVTFPAPGDGGDEPGPEPSEPPRHGSLSSHLERAIARLTMMRGGELLSDERIDAVVRELDGIRASARGLRGSARSRCLDRLRDVDANLLEEARERLSEATLAELRVEAARGLEAFRERLPADAYRRALQTSLDQLIRTRVRLPTVAFD